MTEFEYNKIVYESNTCIIPKRWIYEQLSFDPVQNVYWAYGGNRNG